MARNTANSFQLPSPLSALTTLIVAYLVVLKYKSSLVRPAALKMSPNFLSVLFQSWSWTVTTTAAPYTYDGSNISDFDKVFIHKAADLIQGKILQLNFLFEFFVLGNDGLRCRLRGSLRGHMMS